MLETALELLRDADLDASAKKGELRLREAGKNHVFGVTERRRAPRPHEVEALPTPQGPYPLLMTTYVSEGTGKALSSHGWSWVDTCGNWDIRAPGLRLQRRVQSSPPQVESRTLPTRGKSLAIVRLLLHIPDDAVSPTAIAERVGTSQPQASQVLHKLEDQNLVSHPSRFEWHIDRQELLRRWLDEYPGPRGTPRYYYSLEAPNEAAATLQNTLAKKERAYISGDVAADLLAPYRAPEHLVVYQTSDWRKLPKDWVKAKGPDDANITVIVPQDESVSALRVERVFKDTTLKLADPTQVLWDLYAAGGDDREEAADKLEQWILSTPRAS